MNIRIQKIQKLISPKELIYKLNINDNDKKFIIESRETISRILNNQINKKLVIVGPCSIHDIKSAKEYCLFLKEEQKKYDNLCLVMRTYFEKPRTTVGWKGLIYDPILDNSNNINLGLELSRELLLFCIKNKIPTATEFVDSIVPQYISDLICWAAIGARTTSSQVHRQLSSGLSMPVGFKNDINGNIDIAIDSIISANHKHCFMGINEDGVSSIVSTKGNHDCHIILRGGINKPNYYEQDVYHTTCKLGNKKLKQSLVVDFSHGNSLKLHKKQIEVCINICNQCKTNKNIVGVMIESNLIEGNQKISDNMVYGQSITDSCLNLDDTKNIFDMLNNI
tara:strand:- start:382 stop:1392 length:1011 start_codon:yes stop_codon:yes gene_type:complete